MGTGYLPSSSGISGAGPSGVVAIVARIWTTLVEVVPAAIFWIGYVTGRAPRDGTTEAA